MTLLFSYPFPVGGCSWRGWKAGHVRKHGSRVHLLPRWRSHGNLPAASPLFLTTLMPFFVSTWAGGHCCQATREQVYLIHSHPPPHHLSENTALGSGCCFPEGTVLASVLSADVEFVASENPPRVSAMCSGPKRDDRMLQRLLKKGEALHCTFWQTQLQCHRVLLSEQRCRVGSGRA